MTLLVNGASWAVALVATNLGLLNILCGAVSVFFFVGLFPALITNTLLVGRSREKAELMVPELEEGLLSSDGGAGKYVWPSRFGLAVLVVFSFLGMCLGLVNTTNYSDALMGNCQLEF